MSTLKRLNDLTGLKVGDRLVRANGYNLDEAQLYWVTVTKVTPKTVTVNQAEGGYKSRVTIFRQTKNWRSEPEVVAYGEGSFGFLARAETDEDAALVEASIQQRAEAAAVEQAKRDAEAAKADAYRAEARRQALATNHATTFEPFATLGDVQYFQGHVRNHGGRDCLVIIGAMYGPDRYNYSDAQPAKVWTATLNYAEAREPGYEYGPASISCSDLTGNTLPELFENAIVRVW